MSFLCVSVAETSTRAAVECFQKAVARFPVVKRIEVRLDALDRPDPEALARACPDGVEMLQTCRAGGALAATTSERLELLKRAAAEGVDLIDVDADEVVPFRQALTSIQGSVETAPRLVVSHHDHVATPGDEALRATLERLGELAREPGDVVKLATTALEATDGLRVLSQARRFTARTGRTAVAMAMGDRGVASRVLAPVFGLDHTYAAAEFARLTAPGQLTVEDMVEVYRFAELAPDWSVYGLLGEAIGASPSPAMHNACFRDLGLRCVYVPLECSHGSLALEKMAKLRIAGLSVTTPHKQAAMAAASDCDEATRQIGAANTLRLSEAGGWHASNTDAEAAADSLEAVVGQVSGRRVGLVGAGGAARAVGHELVRRGAKLVLHARRPEAARKVAAVLGAEAGCLPGDLVAGDCEILVNGTPLGGVMALGASPVAPDAFEPGMTAFDMVYWPLRTRFLIDAESRGAQCLGGLDMLVRQAAGQIHSWTRERVPLKMLREVAEASLRVRGQEEQS